MKSYYRREATHIIQMSNVSEKYGGKFVILDIDLSISEGRLTAFTGSNGTGKSMLLAMMSRLIPKDTGEIYLDKQEVKTWKQSTFSQKVTLLKQTNGVQLKLTVRELVNFGRSPYSKNRLKNADHEEITETLEQLGLTEMAEEYIDTLSGGQLQRACIAMILARDADYILSDEPLSNPDMNYMVQMMQILKRLVDELGRIILVVLHNINFTANYTDEAIAIKDGKPYVHGATEEVIQTSILNGLCEVDVWICEAERKRFCLYHQTEQFKNNILGGKG